MNAQNPNRQERFQLGLLLMLQAVELYKQAKTLSYLSTQHELQQVNTTLLIQEEKPQTGRSVSSRSINQSPCCVMHCRHFWRRWMAQQAVRKLPQPLACCR